MATSYATYIYNNMPNSGGIASDDLLTETEFPCHRIKYIYVWGFPVYVLDPTL